MLNQRKRAVVWAMAAMAAIWVVAVAGYFIAKNLKVTAEKVKAYVGAVDLSKSAPRTTSVICIAESSTATAS